MRKTYAELVRELTSKTKSEQNIRRRASILLSEVKEYKRRQEFMVKQYERIIKEWRHSYESLINNAWKIVFAKVQLYCKKVLNQ